MNDRRIVERLREFPLSEKLALEAADRIEALEEGAHRLNRKIEWWEDKYRQQACRAEALEAALRKITESSFIDGTIHEAIRGASAALAERQDKK